MLGSGTANATPVRRSGDAAQKHLAFEEIHTPVNWDRRQLDCLGTAAMLTRPRTLARGRTAATRTTAARTTAARTKSWGRGSRRPAARTTQLVCALLRAMGDPLCVRCGVCVLCRRRGSLCVRCSGPVHMPTTPRTATLAQVRLKRHSRALHCTGMAATRTA